MHLKIFRQLYLSNRFYFFLLSIILIFITSHFIPYFYAIGKLLLLIFSVLVILEIILFFNGKKILSAGRKCSERLSNGDDNEIVITVKNHINFRLKLTIIDELPYHFQQREFVIHSFIERAGEKQFFYTLKPLTRGEYNFGNLNIYVSGFLGLILRRVIIQAEKTVPVYPSFIQMKKYELLAISNRLSEAGVKKIRTIGRNNEFDQIKKYNTDDDYRTINWKATARKGEIMVNQYQEEKSQQVYCIIDKGRLMQMPFKGMTLLDYAINSALVISNTALLKNDKAGLLSFSDKTGPITPVSGKKIQIRKIMDALYNLETDFNESNFAMLHASIRKNINQRSLLVLFTNFESIISMQRQVKYLQMISKSHLVLVVFFVNTEVKKMLNKNPENLEEIYISTIAEKLMLEKVQIVKTLQKYGILTVLAEPENITIASINKYLEIKARGLM